MGISVTSKADLRKKVLELRKNLTKEETDGWDQAICQKIKNLGLEKQYGTIYCYISVRGETGTEALIRWYLEQGLKVAVPRVKGREMAFYYIDCFEDLEPGCFGIPEPKKSCMTAEETDAPVIVPGFPGNHIPNLFFCHANGTELSDPSVVPTENLDLLGIAVKGEKDE